MRHRLLTLSLILCLCLAGAPLLPPGAGSAAAPAAAPDGAGPAQDNGPGVDPDG